jgi:hypothetical protein
MELDAIGRPSGRSSIQFLGKMAEKGWIWAQKARFFGGICLPLR